MISMHHQVVVSPSTTIHAISSNPASSQPTIIFLHYWGGSSRTWAKVISHLPTTAPTLTIDFRGWGDSTGPADDDGHAYSMTTLTDDVEYVIQKLEVTKYILVGHSMGAKVAQLLASRNPVGLKGLILLCPASPTPFIFPDEMREQQLHAYDSAQSVEFVARHILSSARISEEDIRQVVEDSLKGNHHAKVAWPGYAMKEDISSEVEKISVNVIIIAAELDKVDTVERVRTEVVSRFKGADFVLLENVGHLAALEDPQTVADVIRQFAEKL